ncbi:MAG: RDD family protein [Treponema sp.]|jgi:uncharacterized RDD family membrane protein YckC|nr:RDD family protein [Treponema sp.]
MTIFDRNACGNDTSLGALTPEGIEFVLFPAGLPVRACAYGIDKTIQWIILIVVRMLSGSWAGSWILLIINFCVDWFYHVFFELMFHGQSPGKYFMGIRVVRSSGVPVDGASSFLRNLLRFADTFFFLCPIALVSIAASPGFRRLGDWIGSTLVVYAPKASLGRKTSSFANVPGPLSLSVSWLDSVAPVIPARILSPEEKQAVLMFARRYPLLGEARADEIARSWVRLLHGDSLSTEETEAAPVSEAVYLLGMAKMLLGDISLEAGEDAPEAAAGAIAGQYRSPA